MNARPHLDSANQTIEVGRVTLCAPSVMECGDGAHGVTRPTSKFKRAAGVTKLSFTLATEADDADIRRLFRENPMAGQIALSLEREPNYFADARIPGTEKQTIIARENGRIVCAGSCSIRQRFVNGRPRRVGYLGGLRLDARASGRFDVLRRGYEFFRELQAAAPADFYFTSIAEDNSRARNFLERGLPGMPAYEFIGEFVTVLLPVRTRRSRREEAHDKNAERGMEDVEEIQSLLTLAPTKFQLAPCWSAKELPVFSRLGLRTKDFRTVRDGGKLIACAALWDQRGFKQTVIRGYARWLELARPAINFANQICGQPRLPGVGTALSHAFVSHLAVAEEKHGALVALIAELRPVAARRGIEFLTLGFAANDPRLANLHAHFRLREYRSRLYLVRWPGIGGTAADLDGRCLNPEVALL